MVGNTLFISEVGLKKILFILLLLIASPVYATNWYIDNAATGTNAGTSWTNAWESFADIVWSGAGVVAGDTIYISGGAAGQTYTEDLVIGLTGAEGNPITIRCGQDAGYTGKVTIYGSITASANRHYIEINGELNGAQNIRIDNHDTIAETAACIAGNSESGLGWHISYLELYNCGTGVTLTDGVVTGPTNHGSAIRLYGTFDSLNNLEIDHNIINNVGHEAITISSGYVDYGNAASWDQVRIHDNVIAHTAANTITTGDGGTSTYNNTLTETDGFFTYFQGAGGTHDTLGPSSADVIEIAGKYDKVYNNIIADARNCAIYLRLNYVSYLGRDECGHIRIYNNYFYNDTGNSVNGHWSIQAQGTECNGSNEITLVDTYIMNNTFVGTTGHSIYIFPRTATSCDTMYTEDVRVENNIIYDCGLVTDEPVQIDIADANTTFKNNVVYGTNNEIRYNGTTYTDAEDINTDLPAVASGNKSSAVTFVNYSSLPWDMKLASGDTTAKDAGIDQSAYFTTDLTGWTRTGTWDIGAYEYRLVPNMSNLGTGAITMTPNNAGAITITPY
jgi:hypothetical protein